MKIIVTGGAGFIGSHIVDAYIRAGHRVAVIDNLKTGFRKNINPKAKFYKTDIENLKAIERIFKKERPEVVNHHAAIAEVAKSLLNPISTFRTNVIGTANVLLVFGKYGRGKRKKFLFSSTGGAIYGESKKIPADEKTTIAPLSPYGLSKFLAEEAIKFYGQQYKFPYFIFRYSNVYGPRQNPKAEAGAVAIFIGLMKQGKRPKIFGDGSKTRDYIHVSDVVRANVSALTKGKDAIVNLGRGREISDLAVFDTIAKVMRFQRKPIYAAFREGEVLRSALDVRQAKKILGWRPKMEFKKGVRQI